MKSFNACALCLERARNPVACSEGHLFCTECVYTDLVTQSRDIKKQKQKLEALRADAAQAKALALEAARERVLKEFEKSQLGLSSKPSTTASTAPIDNPRGTKRKFEFDTNEVDRRTHDAEEEALRVLEREQAEALRAKLPDFWLPSLTPTYTSKGAPQSVKDIKLQTTCRGGNPAHRLTKKDLVDVRFSFPSTIDLKSYAEKRPGAEDEVPFNPRKIEESENPICPSCRKELTNSHRIFLMKPCFHVICKTCTDTLVNPAKQCVVCDKELESKDILELKREGTGFAAGGMAETSKAGISFQG